MEKNQNVLKLNSSLVDDAGTLTIPADTTEIRENLVNLLAKSDISGAVRCVKFPASLRKVNCNFFDGIDSVELVVVDGATSFEFGTFFNQTIKEVVFGEGFVQANCCPAPCLGMNFGVAHYCPFYDGGALATLTYVDQGNGIPGDYSHVDNKHYINLAREIHPATRQVTKIGRHVLNVISCVNQDEYIANQLISYKKTRRGLQKN